MKSTKHHSKLMVACIALISLVALLKAGYYKPDFFPIGLTGLNYTGSGQYQNCPYSNVIIGNQRLWYWDDNPNFPDQTEQSLIEALGVNCLGVSDGLPRYFLDLTNQDVTNNYLHKVCNDSNGILLIPPIYQTDIKFYECPDNWLCQYYTGDSLSCCQDTFWRPPGDDCIVEEGVGKIRPSSLFRSPHRPPWGGFGSMLFTLYNSAKEDMTAGTGCHGSYENNWSSFDGDDLWREMADTAIANFGTFYTSGYLDRVWGWNLMAEDPAIYNKDEPNDIWLQGAWAAVDRIFNGSNTIYQDSIPHWDTEGHRPDHTGIRGIEGGTNRMIVAKGGLGVLHRYELDIFEALPDIDVFVDFSHGWCAAKYNYGEQGLFDNLLYNPDANLPGIAGYHNNAIYFQKYGQTNLVRSEQERRWIPWIALEWRLANDSAKTQGIDNTQAYVRRPCPPEIRCAAYLLMSRGAKGILFHGWSFPLTVTDAYSKQSQTKPNPNVDIPSTFEGRTYNVGVRDQDGYPFGDTLHGTNPNIINHLLNDGSAPQGETQTYWHNNNTDYTYSYLCVLIPELKKITSTLVNLDWINAYSLKSTSSEWSSPCPHMYVKSISGADYVDLGFFNDPNDAASEYFMLVNREGIADMTNRTLIITLDGACWPPSVTSLQVTDMADTLNPRTINRTGSVFQFTQTFEPGEGKLYRVKATNGSIPRKLNLIGEWRESRVASGYMNILTDGEGGGLGYAKLDWRWLKDKPASLEAMQLWVKNDGANQVWQEGNTIDDPPFPDQCTHWWGMGDSVMFFVEVGEHPDGDSLWPDEFGIGTQSNTVRVVHPEHDPGGCPDLYTYMDRDTSLQYGYAFLENNTILPHSEHISQMDDDYLRLDALNSEPDYYYMALVENDYQKTYLDMVKLWVVDHPENTGVVTSASDSIYCYSDEIGPKTCTDASQSDQLDKILWEDTTSYGGIGSAYLDVSFDDPGWSEAGLMVTMGMRGYPQPPDKDYYSVPSEPAGGSWDSLGSAYGRMNCSQWVVDVSACDSFRFRVFCRGSDTCFIDRIALVKLEDDYDITEAELDSAVKYDIYGNKTTITALVMGADTLKDSLRQNEQFSLRFDKVDTSTSYTLRDYVFQSRGLYSSVLLQGSGITEVEPLVFDLEVEQVMPFSSQSLLNYSVPYATHVKITVYDIAGRLVKTVVNEETNPGRHSFDWNGSDNASRSVASGVYFVKMITDDYKETVKFVILN